MSSEKIIDSLFDNNLEKFRSEVRTALYAKAGEYMNSAKQVVSGAMMNPPEGVNEALKGKQHEIDANNNGKIDADDFKKLRKKKMNEGYVYPEGEVDDDCFANCHQKTVHGTTGGDQYHAAWTNCYNKCKKKG